MNVATSLINAVILLLCFHTVFLLSNYVTHFSSYMFAMCMHEDIWGVVSSIA